MTVHKIGDAAIILEEIAAIGTLHLNGANHSLLDIYLKGGAKVVAEISANKEDQVGQSDLSSVGFVKMRERVINEFKEAFETINSPISPPCTPHK